MNPTPPDLAVSALRCDGSEFRWDNRSMEPGVHLRWNFRSDLGFPLHGFTVHRAKTTEVDCSTAYLTTQPTNEIHLSSSEDIQPGAHGGVRITSGNWLRVTFDEPMKQVSLGMDVQGAFDLTAYSFLFGAVPVANLRLSGNGIVFPEPVLKANSIDSVVTLVSAKFGRKFDNGQASRQ